LIAVVSAAMIRCVSRGSKASACIGGVVALLGCDGLSSPAEKSDPSADAEGATPQASDRAGDGADGERARSGAEGDGSDAGSATSRVAWHVQLDTVPRSVAVTDRGTIYTLAEDGIHGWVDGKPAWTKEGEFTAITRSSDGGIVTTTGATILGFDPATGDERFRVDVPAPPDWPTQNRKGEPVPPPAIIVVASFGSQLMVADQEARFFQVDPPTCMKGDQACVQPAGALDGEVLEVGTRLTVSDDGTPYLIEEGTLRVFDPKLETVFELESPGRIIAIAPIGQSGLAVASNGQLSLLQMQHCVDDESARLPSAPTGSKQCVRWRYGVDLDDAAPAVIDEATLAVNGAGRMQAVSEGTDSWKSPIGAVGPVLPGSDGLLYTLAVDDDEGAVKLAVKAVDPRKGTVQWAVPLPFAPAAADGELAADLLIPETSGVDTRGPWIAAYVEQNIALIAVPAEGS
jgi:hypothetical protein